MLPIDGDLKILDRNMATVPKHIRDQLLEALEVETKKGDVLKIKVMGIKVLQKDKTFKTLYLHKSTDNETPKEIPEKEFKEMTKPIEEKGSTIKGELTQEDKIKNLKRVLMDLDSPEEHKAIAKARLLEMGVSIDET